MPIELQRRTVLGGAIAGAALLQSRAFAEKGANQTGANQRVIPWSDEPAPAWGPTPVAAVEVKIDDGPWMKAILDDSKSRFAWRSWHLDWSPAPGEHTVASRAIDKAGNIQPAMDDASIANKKTYWESNGQITRHLRIV